MSDAPEDRKKGLSEVSKPHYAGHRERVRKRFKAIGGDAFEDYELLEILLHIVIPYRDTKALAKEMLARFGSFAAVIGASPARLGEFKGLGDVSITHLKVIQSVAQRYSRGLIDEKMPILSSWTELTEYCRTQMAFETVEQFRILFLDKKNRLIADEVQQRGTVDHTPVYPREVMRRSLELAASAIILVHNHPSGDPSPSAADVRITRDIAELGKQMGITVHDHLIVGRQGFASLKTMRLF